MKVWELKEMLEELDDDTEVVVQPCNCDYAYEPSYMVEGKGVRSFWGKDYAAVVLYAGDQVGAVWDEDELFGTDEEE